MSPPLYVACLLANLNSLIYDYTVRQKLGGTHFKLHYFKQIPVVTQEALLGTNWTHSSQPIVQWIGLRVLELIYTSVDLRGFALDLGYLGSPFCWDEERRFWIRAELDAGFFHLYGLTRDDVAYVAETFNIIRRKDLAAYDHYRTKEGILEVYDAMAEAIRTGVPYVTKLDPPPANGWSPPPLEANGGWVDASGARQPVGRARTGRIREAKTPASAASQGWLDVVQDALSPGDWVSEDGKGGLLIAAASESGKTVFTVLLEGEEMERQFVSPPTEVRRG